MKTFKLSKTFTTVKLGMYILTVFTGIQAQSQATVSGELGSPTVAGVNTTIMSDAQFQQQTCTGVENNVAEALSEFQQACSEAGLGSETSCRRTLLECREEDSEDNESCLNHALTSDDLESTRDRLDEAREREEDLRKRIEDKQADLQELEAEAISLVTRRDQATAEFEQALAELQGQEAEALRRETSELDQIGLEVENIQDQLQVQELELRSFVLENERNCREEANEYKERVYNNMVNAARNGQARYSQNALFSSTGLSARDIAALRADRKLRQCMSLSIHTRRGQRRTAFGSEYALKLEQINLQRQTLQRNIQRLNDQRRVVRQAKADTLRVLSEQQQRRISAFANQKLRLDQESQLLQNRESQIMNQLSSLQMEYTQANIAKMDAEEQMTRQYGSEVRASGDDRRQAFITADRALNQTVSAAERFQSGAANCGDSSFVAGVLDRLTDGDSA